MNVTIVDYNSGNISSVINSFKEVAKDKVNIKVTSDLEKIKSSDKVVLPGQGSFKSCIEALNSIKGLVDTLNEFAINSKKPLLGICVGLQMFADIGYEEIETKGLGWISGKVSKINNQNKIIGVGETGLDFFYNHSDKDLQIKSFEEHIKASIDLNLPLIVHSRNAEKETFDILKKHEGKGLKILMHCFTGSLEFA